MDHALWCSLALGSCSSTGQTHKCSMQPPQGGTSHSCNICTPPRTHRAVCNPLQVLPCQQQKAKCPGFLWKSLERVDKLYTMLGDHVDMRSSWTKQNRASWQTASDRRFPTFSCILTDSPDTCRKLLECRGWRLKALCHQFGTLLAAWREEPCWSLVLGFTPSKKDSRGWVKGKLSRNTIFEFATCVPYKDLPCWEFWLRLCCVSVCCVKMDGRPLLHAGNLCTGTRRWR